MCPVASLEQSETISSKALDVPLVINEQKLKRSHPSSYRNRSMSLMESCGAYKGAQGDKMEVEENGTMYFVLSPEKDGRVLRVIQSPGRFEGELEVVPLLYELSLDGSWPTVEIYYKTHVILRVDALPEKLQRMVPFGTDVATLHTTDRGFVVAEWHGLEEYRGLEVWELLDYVEP